MSQAIEPKDSVVSPEQTRVDRRTVMLAAAAGMWMTSYSGANAAPGDMPSIGTAYDRGRPSSTRPWAHITRIDVKEECVEEFLWRVQEVLDAMRHEKTFISTSMCVHPSDPGKFILFEVWEDKDEFYAVQKSRPYRTAHFQRFPDLLRSPSSREDWCEIRSDFAVHLNR